MTGSADENGNTTFNDGVDRVVFRLTQTAGTGTPDDPTDDAWTFDLEDQLDHAPAAGDTATLGLALTAAFTAADFDGDAVALPADAITVHVENDVPELVSEPFTSITVVEDALLTTAPGDAGDLSDGNLDGGQDNSDDEGTFTYADLSALVSPGADEPLAFELTAFADDTTAVKDTSNVQVKSQGKNVFYHSVSATEVIGFADVDGSGTFNGGDRVVFRLTQTAGTGAPGHPADDAGAFVRSAVWWAGGKIASTGPGSPAPPGARWGAGGRASRWHSS